MANIRPAIQKKFFLSHFLVVLLVSGAVLMGDIDQKIRLQIAQSDCPGEKKVLALTISFGVACYTDEQTIDDCIKAADEALYLAKQQGRNRVVATKENPSANSLAAVNH